MYTGTTFKTKLPCLEKLVLFINIGVECTRMMMYPVSTYSLGKGSNIQEPPPPTPSRLTRGIIVTRFLPLFFFNQFYDGPCIRRFKQP